ncbi:hypothetical protein ACFP1Z_24855 [Streptomyces gamaensis]|uniref:Secreted protein n=1 Tax=Streptomyces gamaensis TaxID=1763542 RepID=A0ABW0Z6D6_9ACTN
MKFSRARKAMTAVLIGGLAVLISAPAWASGSTPTVEDPGDEALPFAIEEFQYPNAEKILKEKGIILRKGDGHIMLVGCDSSTKQIKIMSGAVDYCFTATSSVGYLDLELPGVFGIRSYDHPLQADLIAEGMKKTVTVPKNQLVGAGEGVQQPQTTLVELRVTG